MPRDGGGVFSLPPGSDITNGDTSDGSDLNTPLDDLETDMNTPRPVVAGGTGAASAADARTNLDVPSVSSDSEDITGNWTVSGDWAITGDATFTDDLFLNVTGDNPTAVTFQRGGEVRWKLGGDDENESALNTGTDFYIARYDDDEVLIDTPVEIDRKDGTFTHNTVAVFEENSVLALNGDSSHTVSFVTSSATAGGYIYFGHSPAVYERFTIVNLNGPNIWYFDNLGVCTGPAGGDFVNPSDQALKSNIKNANHKKASTDLVKAFEPKEFSIGNKDEQVGWIAQDVQPHIPSAVHADPETGELALGLRPIVAHLHQALLEALERIEALENA